MRGSHYTAEQNAFIVEHYEELTYKELTSAYNKRFAASMTVSAMCKKCRALNLRRKERFYKSMFTPEVDAYLMENAFRYTASELSDNLREKFGISPATQTVTWHLNDLGIHRGSNFLPDGYTPRASKQIGAERIEKGRYIKVKVAQPNVWVPKASLVMGYDPKKYQAIYLDGNPLNVVPDNIIVVSKRVHARLAKNGWLNRGKDILMAGIKWSELLYAIQDLNKQELLGGGGK